MTAQVKSHAAQRNKTSTNENVARLTDQAMKTIDDSLWKNCIPNSANLQKEDFLKI
jgi:hypothetical protein